LKTGIGSGTSTSGTTISAVANKSENAVRGAIKQFLGSSGPVYRGKLPSRYCGHGHSNYGKACNLSPDISRRN
jgi:hypothetical protein